MKIRIGINRKLSSLKDLEDFQSSKIKTNGLPIYLYDDKYCFYLMQNYWDNQKRKFVNCKSKVPYYEYRNVSVSPLYLRKTAVTGITMAEFFDVNKW